MSPEHAEVGGTFWWQLLHDAERSVVCPRQSVSPITGGCVAPAERWYVLGGRLVRGVSPKHTVGWRLRDCGVSPGELFRALSGPERCMAPIGGC